MSRKPFNYRSIKPIRRRNFDLPSFDTISDYANLPFPTSNTDVAYVSSDIQNSEVERDVVQTPVEESLKPEVQKMIDPKTMTGKELANLAKKAGFKAKRKENAITKGIKTYYNYQKNFNKETINDLVPFVENRKEAATNFKNLVKNPTNVKNYFAVGKTIAKEAPKLLNYNPVGMISYMGGRAGGEVGYGIGKAIGGKKAGRWGKVAGNFLGAVSSSGYAEASKQANKFTKTFGYKPDYYEKVKMVDKALLSSVKKNIPRLSKEVQNLLW